MFYAKLTTFSFVKINFQSTIKTAISKTAKLRLRGIFRTVKNLKWMSFLQIIVYSLKPLNVFVKSTTVDCTKNKVFH